jgi:hypothetical protein
MRVFLAVVQREAQRRDWLAERGGFEPSSPFSSRSFRDLVGILRSPEKIVLAEMILKKPRRGLRGVASIRGLFGTGFLSATEPCV